MSKNPQVPDFVCYVKAVPLLLLLAGLSALMSRVDTPDAVAEPAPTAIAMQVDQQDSAPSEVEVSLP